MGSMKVWDGTAWQTVSAGPSLPPVTSVDGRTGAVSLSDLYAAKSTGNTLVQGSSAAATTDANGIIAVTFPAAYSVMPAVVALAQNAAGLPGPYFTSMHYAYGNTFAFRIFNDAGAPMVNSTFGYTWVAVGPRP